MKRILTIIILISSMAWHADAQTDTLLIDKVVAVVGKEPILLSEIENQYIQLIMQGIDPAGDVKCTIFEEMLFQKLLLHKADLDSVVIAEADIESQMDRRLAYVIQQFGGDQSKLEEYYGKSIIEIKEEFRELFRDQMKIEQVQGSLTSNVKATPNDVSKYYKSIPEDSIPYVQANYSLAQISITPKVSEEIDAYILERIEEIREDIVNGKDFALMARLYSQDPGSKTQGGELGTFGRGVMAPEFEAAAFKLKHGEISQVVKTDFGYHILKLIDRKGDFINVRHILLIPEPSDDDLYSAANKLDSIKGLIELDSLSFEQAVLKYSDDPGKVNGGKVINQATGTNLFTAEEMDQNLFFMVDKMEVDDISKPLPYLNIDRKKSFRIVQLEKRIEPHVANLDDDYSALHAMALQEKKIEAISEWIDKQAAKTFIRIIDAEYAKCDLNNKWIPETQTK